MSEPIDELARRWTALGALFNCDPAPELPDLERLLIDTVRHGSARARIFIMAATWLNRFGDLVARHRLRRLIQEELGPREQAGMGLLLDLAQAGTHPPRFAWLIADLKPHAEPEPWFEIERSPPAIAELTRDRATEIGLRWGFWVQPIEFKFDALRPAHWLVAQDHELMHRADFRGDLRASVIAALRYDTGSGQSEVRLAAFAGGSRAQVRNALRNLELTGRVAVARSGGTQPNEIRLGDVA